MRRVPRYKWIEEVVDRHGVTRIYGYTKGGLKFWLNIYECLQIYKERGIKDLKRNI